MTFNVGRLASQAVDLRLRYLANGVPLKPFEAALKIARLKADKPRRLATSIYAKMKETAERQQIIDDHCAEVRAEEDRILAELRHDDMID